VTGTPSPHEGDMRYLFEDCSSRIFVLPTLHREIDLITDFRTVISLYRLMRRIRPHIVDSHTAKAGFATRIAAFFLRIFSRNGPLTVHTFHGNVFKGYFKPSKTLAYIWIERALARITDIVIAISPAQKKELVHTYKIASDEKVKVVPLGLELDRFLTCGKLNGKFRHRFSIDKDCFLIGIVGRLVPIKNHVMFLKAAKIFVSEHPDINVRFAVVGDGELRDELESLTRKMGLREKVTFCGWIKGIQAVYSELDALVLTSINEGTPVSIIEAMASCVPIISTCVGGVRDLIGSPKGSIESGDFAVCSRGILCNSGDFLGLARALEYLLNEDEEQKEKRLVAALEFVRQRYSKTRLLSDMESLYTDLLKKNHY
ncbi:MAG TPA: glycosyltransferase family 1 protein, partial [Desulfobacterales bacterium]|nr:glycosyltransferase family 1 protein [Desulfobacterales bacterium]